MLINSLKSTWQIQFGAFMVLLGLAYHAAILQLQAPFYNISTFAIGLISTSYFMGFLVSCITLVHLVNKIGHIKLYSAMAAIYTMACVLFSFSPNTPIWVILYVICGFTAGGLFIVIESWLNESCQNTNRGQIIGMYVAVLTFGKIAGNYAVNLMEKYDVRHFSLAAMAILLTILPMLMSDIKASKVSEAKKISFSRLYVTSPAAVVIMFLCQIGAGVVNGLGVTYAALLGFTTLEIGNFMSVIFLATIILQYPLGKLSDSMDRRFVMILVASLLLIGCLGLIFFSPTTPFFFISLFIMGGAVFSCYPLCLAHMNDFLKDDKRVAASGQMLLLASAGSMVGPITASAMMDYLGHIGFATTMAFEAVLIIAFLLYRLKKRKGLGLDEQKQRSHFAIASNLIVPLQARKTIKDAQ